MKLSLITLVCSLSISAFLHGAPPPQKGVPAFTTTLSGLKYADMKPGKGPLPKAGQTLSVLYRGWLYDTEKGRQGKLFDQNTDAKRPFRFTLGAGQVIRGWDEGCANLAKGGKRVLIIPPSLGYGDQGAGNAIPPGATLLFEIQLLDIQ